MTNIKTMAVVDSTYDLLKVSQDFECWTSTLAAQIVEKPSVF